VDRLQQSRNEAVSASSNGASFRSQPGRRRPEKEFLKARSLGAAVWRKIPCSTFDKALASIRSLRLRNWRAQQLAPAKEFSSSIYGRRRACDKTSDGEKLLTWPTRLQPTADRRSEQYSTSWVCLSNYNARTSRWATTILPAGHMNKQLRTTSRLRNWLHTRPPTTVLATPTSSRALWERSRLSIIRRADSPMIRTPMTAYAERSGRWGAIR